MQSLTTKKEKTMKKTLHFTFATLLALFTTNAIAETAETAPVQPQAVEQVQTTEQNVRNLNLVNLNTATAAEIQDKLVGIGAKKAQAIVEYREKHGKFISVEQVTEVSGIGKATLDKNRDRIVIE